MPVREKLSLLWVFLFLNYIFCDVFSLMYPPMIQQMAVGDTIDGIAMTGGFLLGFAVVMEVGMLMVLGARFLPYGLNRAANIVIGLGLAVVQVGSLFAGSNTPHYYFFSAVEVVCLLVIVWTTMTWHADSA